MNQRVQYLFCLFCLNGLAGSGGTALAQDNDVPPKATRYEVELIVFRHIDQSRNTPEIPAEDSLIRESPLTLNPADDADEPFMNTLEIGGNDLGSPTPIEQNDPMVDARDRMPRISFFLMEPKAQYPDFFPIDDASLELNSVFRRLEDLDAYRPLVHLGWIQTTKSAAEAVSYQVYIRDQDRDDLTGSITLYRERFLHLELDLALDPGTEEFGNESDFYATDSFDALRTTGRRQHKLMESRRIRGANSHYFDHPLFGVIARIQKIVVEPPAPESEAASTRNPG
jgi:hypothetical protein